MRSPRDPADVIDRVLAELPDGWDDLRAVLLRIKSDSRYLPPEYKQPAWLRLRDALSSQLSSDPGTRPAWQSRISAIVRGEHVDA